MDKEKNKSLTSIDIKEEHKEAMEAHRKVIHEAMRLLKTANTEHNSALDDMFSVVKELYPETEGYVFAINWEPMRIVLTRKKTSFEEWLEKQKDLRD